MKEHHVALAIIKGELPKKPEVSYIPGIFNKLWALCEECWKDKSFRPTAREIVKRMGRSPKDNQPWRISILSLPSTPDTAGRVKCSSAQLTFTSASSRPPEKCSSRCYQRALNIHCVAGPVVTDVPLSKRPTSLGPGALQENVSACKRVVHHPLCDGDQLYRDESGPGSVQILHRLDFLTYYLSKPHVRITVTFRRNVPCIQEVLLRQKVRQNMKIS